MKVNLEYEKNTSVSECYKLGRVLTLFQSPENNAFEVLEVKLLCISVVKTCEHFRSNISFQRF